MHRDVHRLQEAHVHHSYASSASKIFAKRKGAGGRSMKSAKEGKATGKDESGGKATKGCKE